MWEGWNDMSHFLPSQQGSPGLVAELLVNVHQWYPCDRVYRRQREVLVEVVKVD